MEAHNDRTKVKATHQFTNLALQIVAEAKLDIRCGTHIVSKSREHGAVSVSSEF
jgi:hypothetical protein